MVERTDLHAPPTSGTQVVVHVNRVLDDLGMETVSLFLDRSTRAWVMAVTRG